MKISLEWLKEYVKFDIPASELVDKLTMIGLMVDSQEEKDGDLILDIETYANRPDTLGHLGIARELAAAYGLSLEKKTWAVSELEEDTAGIVGIQIMDEALCPRYCGLAVKDVKVGPSPDWLRRRIEAMGLKSVNNVVDVTNYVLFATGQPIHAFDLAKLEGGRVLIRRAKKGETIIDLDGRRLELTSDMLVIADAVKPQAVAGVIGGAGSAISESTRDILIESATFDPVSIRLTGKSLGISTDASFRYERGTDIGFPPQAARMVASLLSGMGGKAARTLIDLYPKPRKGRAVLLRRQRVIDLLGTPVEAEFIERTLAGLGFKLSGQQNGAWLVEVPSYRVDIDREADLIEEIARFYGYDRIPSEPTPARSFEPAAGKKRDRLNRIRRAFLPQGFDEVINWSFADPEVANLFGQALVPVPLKNPISVKASLLRTNLLAGLLENAAWNFNRDLEGVHIFEIGNIYYLKDEKPAEELMLGILSAGLLPGGGWWGKKTSSDFFVLKGALEAFMKDLRYEPFTFEKAVHPFFEDGFCLSVACKGLEVGSLGLVRKGIQSRFSIDRPVYAAEMSLARLFEKQPRPFQYVSIPKFPCVVRDISFLIDERVPFEEIKKVVGRVNVSWIEAIELIDHFSGPPVPKGKVSLTIRFRYRHSKKTLQAVEVDQVEGQVIEELKSAFDIQLREGKIDK